MSSKRNLNENSLSAGKSVVPQKKLKYFGGGGGPPVLDYQTPPFPAL